jgi:hypothetical protein
VKDRVPLSSSWPRPVTTDLPQVPTWYSAAWCRRRRSLPAGWRVGAAWCSGKAGAERGLPTSRMHYGCMTLLWWYFVVH